MLRFEVEVLVENGHSGRDCLLHAAAAYEIARGGVHELWHLLVSRRAAYNRRGHIRAELPEHEFFVA